MGDVGYGMGVMRRVDKTNAPQRTRGFTGEKREKRKEKRGCWEWSGIRNAFRQRDLTTGDTGFHWGEQKSFRRDEQDEMRDVGYGMGA